MNVSNCQDAEREQLEDMLDQAIADARRDEPERPLSELLARHLPVQG